MGGGSFLYHGMRWGINESQEGLESRKKAIRVAKKFPRVAGTPNRVVKKRPYSQKNRNESQKS